ncbi:MAG: hypothetical protein IOD12_07395 [Silvanigrellales bacterium]|nr:hypothetical protein [Silvanigrellales bacterium]
MDRPHTLQSRYDLALAALVPPDALDVASVEALRVAFLARWVKVHREGLTPFSDIDFPHLRARGSAENEKEQAFAERVEGLLRKRKGLVSLLSQALAKENAKASEALRVSLRRWIERHDAAFGSIVEEELARLRGELTKAYEARRAIGAYVQTLKSPQT